MKKIKIMIIITGIVVLILGALLIYNLNRNKISVVEVDDKNTTNNTEDGSIKEENELTKDKISEKKYYTVMHIIEDYVGDENLTFVPLNIKLNSGIYVDKYLVDGYFVNNNYKVIERMYLYVNLDNSNKTYSIEKINRDNINFDSIELNNEDNTIQNNSNNYFGNIIIDDNYIVKKSFEYLKMNLILNSKFVYQNLDKEYSKVRFNNEDSYKQYIQENLEKIKSMNILKFTKDTYNGKERYILINNYYDSFVLITDKNNVDYKIMLDNYTIRSSEDIAKYKKASNKNKVYTNIQTFIYMLNNKDYESAYNVLDDDFKDVNNINLQNFKEYITNKLFDYNVISSNSNFAESEDGQYLMTVILKNRLAVAADQKEIRFVVILGEDTKFKITILD